MIEINLLPEENKERNKQNRIIGLVVVISFFLLILYLGIAIFYFITQANFEFFKKNFSSQITYQQNRNQEMMVFKNNLKEARKTIELAKTLKESSPNWPEILAKTQKAIPLNAQLISLSGQEKTLELKGYALDYETVIQLKNNLEQAFASLAKSINLQTVGLANPSLPHSLIDYTITIEWK